MCLVMVVLMVIIMVLIVVPGKRSRRSWDTRYGDMNKRRRRRTSSNRSLWSVYVLYVTRVVIFGWA